MYVGYELTLENIDVLENDSKYTDYLNQESDSIVEKFNEVLLSDGKIDASKVIDEWFPNGEYHIFISHSHKDRKIAEHLANWLYEKFNLTSFLDSHVWGYANNLLKELNDKYAKSGDELYAYEPAISNAAHVYLMLSTALTEAIDKSECLFFINTPNTLQDLHIEGGEVESRTASPWIMHELKTSSMLRKEHREMKGGFSMESAGNESVQKNAEFSFNVPTEHLVKIDEAVLSQWVNDCEPDFVTHSIFRWPLMEHKKEFEALDILYTLTLNNKESYYESES
ncbi:TPA: toll/interleukin-1 receptor domain-containing protein [Vibrio parahaemolyticus]|uniref:toll/interleukin-1 receptor domain-containing protein n=1 Tax=Vibrio parahaemolyticus TaxID=670 RepID=UPI000946B325|nr:toll/interleukin-1 receptor domain-containing protein [Vibrio parahaemolyticus]OLF42301.1 hypothetical protein BUQ66_24045 [Vibrio parahaemolyticus]HCG8581356.1 toll/interleukin-1 receptor domain-containing protein [Vibrio parahaemolyticus]HCM1082205.1 toll/interleukin-1 receptor domain-containing protein [Vibrio parahaemolyticus]